MKKILIVEDDPIISRLYRDKYEMTGYDVAVAFDGETGLRQVKDFQPDLVQLDLMLPRLSGVEVIKKIRAQPELKSLPIIVLSNCCFMDSVKEAWRAGANKCISKINCSPKVILDVIEELLSAPASPAPPPPPAPAPAPPPVPVASSFTPPSEVAIGHPATRAFSRGATQLEIRREFLLGAPQIEAALRSQLRALIKGEDLLTRLPYVNELARSVHALADYSGISGLERIAHLASVLEVLLIELRNRPKQVTPSTLRTITRAVDGLALLFAEPPQLKEDLPQTGLVVAVDDEPISRQMLAAALDKANLRRIILSDPELALKVLADNPVDLVFTDINMRGVDGFELCKQLHASPANQATPVVFVTSLSDFESRTRSTLSGGIDFIAKPFLLIELAVKALTLLIKTKPIPAPSLSVNTLNVLNQIKPAT